MMETYANHINNTGILDELLREVASAADALEERIEEHIVDSVNNPFNGGQIEAVMHIRENGGEVVDYAEDDVEIDSNDILVDSQNNKYVLSKPKDSTAPLIDHHLVMVRKFVDTSNSQ
jgi:hypothetical protein